MGNPGSWWWQLCSLVIDKECAEGQPIPKHGNEPWIITALLNLESLREWLGHLADSPCNHWLDSRWLQYWGPRVPANAAKDRFLSVYPGWVLRITWLYNKCDRKDSDAGSTGSIFGPQPFFPRPFFHWRLSLFILSPLPVAGDGQSRVLVATALQFSAR